MAIACRKVRTHKERYHRGCLENRRNAVAPIVPGPLRCAVDVERALARAIRLRTGGQVRSLQVQIIGSRVILCGWAVSYHAIQLALAGLFETLCEMNLDRPDEIELDIDVICSDSSSS